MGAVAVLVEIVGAGAAFDAYPPLVATWAKQLAEAANTAKSDSLSDIVNS
jgi:hypothetical protein